MCAFLLLNAAILFSLPIVLLVSLIFIRYLFQTDSSYLKQGNFGSAIPHHEMFVPLDLFLKKLD